MPLSPACCFCLLWKRFFNESINSFQTCCLLKSRTDYCCIQISWFITTLLKKNPKWARKRPHTIINYVSFQNYKETLCIMRPLKKILRYIETLSENVLVPFFSSHIVILLIVPTYSQTSLLKYFLHSYLLSAIWAGVENVFMCIINFTPPSSRFEAHARV